MTRTIYLDHNATTPVDPAVLAAMLPHFKDEFGNAASIDHLHGHTASAAVETARAELANVIGAEPSEIVFTSGATESNNLAILGTAHAHVKKGKHIVTTQIEHPSVLETVEHLEQNGFQITRIPVNREGLVDPAAIEAAIRPETVLVSVMAANNEVGTLAPLCRIGEICVQKGTLFHTDAAQAMAHVDIDVHRDGIHLMSLSAHKMYGPKGVGALYVRRRRGRVELVPQSFGGGHERGLRSGTLNVPGIVGMATAARLAKASRTKETKRLRKIRDALLADLRSSVPDLEVNGSLEHRLPGNINVRFPGVENRALIQLVAHRISLSAGSACTTTEVTPSHVLLAMGLSETAAHESVRMSIGRFTSEADVSTAGEVLSKAIRQLSRARSPSLLP